MAIAKPMFSAADADALTVMGGVARTVPGLYPAIRAARMAPTDALRAVRPGPKVPEKRTPDMRNRRGPKAPAVSHHAH